jgi:hydroxyethylthiazole kinase
MVEPITIDNVYAALEDLRAKRPLVQNITNYVAMTVSANVLLALGASPAMVHAVEEVEDFVAIADTLAVNIGTLSPPWVEAMRVAVKRANALGKPWVLDPVGCGATVYRTQVAAELAALKPSLIRGNASEIMSLAGQVGAGGKGVDSTAPAEYATSAAAALAQRTGSIVAITGETDYVSDGTTLIAVHAAVDCARLFAQRGECGLYRGAAAARGRRRRARRVRRGRQHRGGALPRTRSSAGGDLRRAASNGRRHACCPRPVVGVS